MKHRAHIVGAALLTLSLAGAGMTRAATQHHRMADPTSPAKVTVVAGWGDNGGAANIYTPSAVEIYAGDTVTWKIGGDLEPHTITFGPTKMLDQLAAATFVPVPQKAGPPMVIANPKLFFPTQGTTYDGTGFANSGFLARKGQSWSLTFVQPGTYKYYCLIHYRGGADKMSGTVIVQARPAMAHHYIVSAGSQYETTNSALDTFFPRALTIHAGDSVTWMGFFHTVTFGPEAMLSDLEQHFVTPVPQKAGPPTLVVNPKALLPSGGPTYDGSGFVNSGVMVLNARGKGVPSYTLTFTKPGTYTYDCLIHPHMDGTITVLATGA